MKIFLMFTLHLMSIGGETFNKVTGYSGGSVLIKCKYDKSYISTPKYFCKMLMLKCANQISTIVKKEWADPGKFSLFDNTSTAELQVLIRDLTVEDSGMYRCVASKDSKQSICSTMELKIMELNKGLHYDKSINLVGHVKGDLNISCKYPTALKNKNKFFCKRLGSTGCNYKTPVEEGKKWIKVGLFSFYDDRETDIFTVSSSNLTKGEYWCGAESDWESDHGYKVYITQINHRVTSPNILSLSSTSTSSLTMNPTTLLSSTTTLPSSGDKSSAPSAAPVITVVSVIVVLLLIGILVFIFILQKRNNNQDPQSTTSQSLRGPSNNHMVPVAIYEEFKDTRCPLASGTRASTVYSTVNLSTNPSQTVYDNIQLPANLCDFTNPVYSTAQLP
ncbi:polymeric immunoglobulin receptor-like isoform X2 [Salminus brasiliensis]|uniref:polymeric immunoglobulin receptor-like isoform X2 n=1 Tax=Salminus brasiliensis TaxID=930266 RepID=UPI003B8379DD